MYNESSTVRLHRVLRAPAERVNRFSRVSLNTSSIEI